MVYAPLQYFQCYYFMWGTIGLAVVMLGLMFFFVISGYLITSILVNDIKNNTYSILDFYERRIRRIVPALVFVIAFIIVASPFFSSPRKLFISAEGNNRNITVYI
ncbi:hypothetical protein A9F12_23655 [Klebsiella pneumoniae]|nr:hypothetical protein A9F12_23655 [Klebsiella pneumoniae]